MVTNIIQAIFNIFNSVQEGMMGLALSPFSRMETLVADNKVLGMLNWIFPFPAAVALLQAWGASIVAWYLFRYVRRYLNSKFEGILGSNGLLGRK